MNTNQIKESPMPQFAVVGWPVMGRSESLLDIITNRIRRACRNLVDALKQPGRL